MSCVQWNVVWIRDTLAKPFHSKAGLSIDKESDLDYSERDDQRTMEEYPDLTAPSESHQGSNLTPIVRKKQLNIRR